MAETDRALAPAENPYFRWAKRYASLFGLTTKEDGAMVVAWIPILQRDGYTPADLEEATDWLASNDPPQWRTEHLGALQKRLREKRQAAHRALIEEPMPGDRGTCATCGGSGMVVVPHPRSVQSGLWATCAVVCSCLMGRWITDHQRGSLPNGEPRPPMLTLGQYEMLVPDWRKRMADHDEKLKLEGQARSHAKHLDQMMGELQRKWPSRRQPGFVRPNPDAS